MDARRSGFRLDKGQTLRRRADGAAPGSRRANAARLRSRHDDRAERTVLDSARRDPPTRSVTSMVQGRRAIGRASSATRTRSRTMVAAVPAAVEVADLQHPAKYGADRTSERRSGPAVSPRGRLPTFVQPLSTDNAAAGVKPSASPSAWTSHRGSKKRKTVRSSEESCCRHPAARGDLDCSLPRCLGTGIAILPVRAVHDGGTQRANRETQGAGDRATFDPRELLDEHAWSMNRTLSPQQPVDPSPTVGGSRRFTREPRQLRRAG